MKEKIFVSNRKVEGAEQIGNLYFVGNNISNNPDYVIYLDGYIVDEDFEESKIADIYKKQGISGFNKFGGKFNIVVYSKSQNLLEWTNDFLACMTLYYYNKDGLFMLSNQFWNMVDVINPEESDIDFEIIAQLAVYGSLLDKNSYIKGIKIVETASNNKYDSLSGFFSSIRYEDFSSYNENEMSLEEATDVFQQSIVKAVKFLKKKHGNDRIGTALSGGLDSRIVPALFGDNIDYFVITGPQRLKRWGTPHNFRCIDKLADVYGIKLKKICQDETPLNTKIFFDIKNCPNHEDNSTKIISKNLVGFDILLTSGAPNLLETDRTMYKSGMKLMDIIEKFQGHRYLKKSRRKTLRGLLNYFFVKRKNSLDADFNEMSFEDFYPIKSMPKESFYANAHRKIEEFTHLKENPQDALLYYLYDMHNTENSYGAFESFGCQMKFAYSYFHPWVNKTLKNMPLKYIENRTILKNLIKKYYPDVENIPSEHSIIGIYNEKKISPWYIIKDALLRKICGFSAFAAYTIEQKKEALSLFEQKSSWYDSLFYADMVKKTIDTQQDIFRIHLKIKLILRIIEQKDWKKYMS